MILATVQKRVVSTAKLGSLPDRQYLEVTPEEGFGKREPLIAIDAVQAGPGDRVLVMQEGTGARDALDYGDRTLPAQMVVVAVVDEVQTERD